MAEDKDNLLEHFRQSRRDLLAALYGLSDAQLSEPNLDGWSVKDHLAHVALWDEIRASEVVRISAGHESAWRMGEEQEAAFGPMMYALRRDISAAQARWELESSRSLLLDAISAATPRALDGSLYGEASLRSTHEAQHTGWIARWRGERGL